ncbi:MAG: HEAT repeat domain-containing protein, partial [Pseudomonadota bacterium]|nr:HEAT repeat domain-containing protein [Pseudomonadota bacterium]
INNHPNVSFFDYFHSLLKRNKAVDAATATAVELFPADLCLTLLCAIPEREPRLTGLTLLKTRHPKLFFNDLLLENDLLLIREKPELLDFLGPSLNPEEESNVANLVATLLTTNGLDVEYAIHAAGRLKLGGCRPQLHKLLDDTPAAAGALARLGDEEGCKKLLKAGKSWRRKKRTSALSDLAGCQNPEAFELLQNRARQGNLDERREALAALSERRNSKALQTILDLLNKTNKKEELNLLLQTLAGSPWPGETREAANQLAQWSENIELYPRLLKALASLGYGENWADILDKLKSPVLKPHYREIALFMCRFAESPKTRQKLMALLGDIDWSFSYRLLNLLSPQLISADIPLLLALLKEREELRALTIKERLTKGRDLERMTDALAEFFQQHPEIANLTIEKLLTAVTIGTQPSGEELFANIKKQPVQLIELLLGPGDVHDAATRDFPLLMAMHLLSEIEVDGSDCFAIVVHRTRRYSGFFRQSINTVLNLLLDKENELDNFQSLPILNKIIDFIRGRPHYDELRQKILDRITKITRNSRELKVYNEASQTRELKVFKVRKL